MYGPGLGLTRPIMTLMVLDITSCWLSDSFDKTRKIRSLARSSFWPRVNWLSFARSLGGLPFIVCLSTTELTTYDDDDFFFLGRSNLIVINIFISSRLSSSRRRKWTELDPGPTWVYWWWAKCIHSCIHAFLSLWRHSFVKVFLICFSSSSSPSVKMAVTGSKKIPRSCFWSLPPNYTFHLSDHSLGLENISLLRSSGPKYFHSTIRSGSKDQQSAWLANKHFGMLGRAGNGVE